MFGWTAPASAAPRARASAAIRALRTRTVAVFATVTLAAQLAACALGTPSAVSNIGYDLGPAPASPATGQPLAASRPTLRMFDVQAPRSLDSEAILYRLAYVDPHRTAAYANSHWTMTPAALLTERLRAALAANGAVLGGGAAQDAPLLSVDLEQFEQVFDGEGQSHGQLRARVTLTQAGRLLAQRTFVARAPASTPNAAGGVHALAAASDDFVAQLIAWLGMQPIAAAH
jgi:cholesterol transport system auxiliary component